uniref:Thioredoxin n=1 Tax=Deltalsia parasitica TaxID=1424640 RepID=UPI0022FD4E75|nr:Thioredoxin [Deltalsia parasitica]WAX02878.1 Thioredoxin [Deltalsia parasitica]
MERLILPIVQVVDSDFNSEVIKSRKIVLVDFGAPWCGPCRMIAPVISEIAQEYESTIKVVKINTDSNASVAAEYGIRSIPTLMIFKNGIKIDTVIGAVPRSTLLNTLNKYI